MGWTEGESSSAWNLPQAKQYSVAGGGHQGPSLAAKTLCEKKSLVDLFIFCFPIPFLETIAYETNRYGNEDWVSPLMCFDDDTSLFDGDNGEEEPSNKIQRCPKGL